MKLRRTVLSVATFLGTAYLLTFTACDEDGEVEGGVVYIGGTTDEALNALTAASAKSDSSKAITFEAPAKDEVVSRDSPFTFVWSEAGAEASIDPLRLQPLRLEAPGRTRSPFERALGVMLEDTPKAYAHGDPYSGVAYFLSFSSSSAKDLVRVFTTNTDYTPSDNDWNKLKGVEGTITLRLTWAEFETNRIVEGGGPWETPPLAFTIQ